MRDVKVSDVKAGDELWELNCNAEEYINDAAYEVYVENGEIV